MVLDKRFLKRSRPRKILRVAETRVVVWGASVVLEFSRLRLNRERLRKSRERFVVEVSGLLSGFSFSDLSE